MATSLAAILFTAVAAAASHAFAGNVAWKEGALIGLPAVAGAVLGACAAPAHRHPPGGARRSPLFLARWR